MKASAPRRWTRQISLAALQLYEAVEQSYRQVDSTLGELPGLSIQAAVRLRDVSRLLDVLSPVNAQLQATLPPTVPVPVTRSTGPNKVQRQARLLGIDLLDLIVRVAKSGKKAMADQGALKTLEALSDEVQRFEYKLSLKPLDTDVTASLQLLRRQLWRAEATINQLDWPAELRGRWRAVRERMNAISDDVGMPRVISLAKTAQTVVQPTSVTSERRIARIYRGSPSVRSGTMSK